MKASIRVLAAGFRPSFASSLALDLPEGAEKVTADGITPPDHRWQNRAQRARLRDRHPQCHAAKSWRVEWIEAILKSS
jgi:hypothetical protein